MVCTTQHLEGRIFHSEGWTLLFIGNDGLINWSILKYTSVCSLGNCPTQWFSRVSPNPDTQCLASATFHDSLNLASLMPLKWVLHGQCLRGQFLLPAPDVALLPGLQLQNFCALTLRSFPLCPREAQQPSLQWCWPVWDGLLKIVPFDLEVSECHF